MSGVPLYTFKHLTDLCLKHGSILGQNLALTVLFVSNSLESGWCTGVPRSSETANPPQHHRRSLGMVLL